MLARRRASGLLLTMACLALAGPAFGQAAPVTRNDDAGPGRSIDPNSLFELVNQIDRLEREVQQLRGQVEQQRFELDSLRARQNDFYTDLDRRLQGMESNGTALTGPGLDSASGAPVSSVSAGNGAPPLAVLDSGGPVPVDSATDPDARGLSVRMESAAATPAAEELAQGLSATPAAVGPARGAAADFDTEAATEAYKSAFALLKSGNYDDAIAAFNDYLVAYPGSEYADNAQYWLGEAYYVNRQFEAAIGEYERLIQAYPQSPKRPHAVLKIGYSEAELGKPDAARARLEQVRSNWPNTTAANLATERLKRLAADSAAAAP